MNPRVLILRAAGTNCDVETAYAFEQAGATATSIHINALRQSPAALADAQLLAIPGGFSFGDDISSGRILADQLRYLADDLKAFIAAGKLIIGICNGFQVLVKTDLLPGSLAGMTGQTCTLTHNTSGQFQAKWIALQSHESRCVWTQNLQPLELPIAHGEGRFVCANDAVRHALWDEQQVALTYTQDCNGSQDNIAGVCDATGRVFGLMPHPERFIDGTQHPAWTSRPKLAEGQGLQIFRNGVAAATEAIGAGV